MEIIVNGNKEAATKLYLKCRKCGCEFAIDTRELGKEFKVNYEHVYIHYDIPCPCCSTIFDLPEYKIDDHHNLYMEKMKGGRSCESTS